MSSLDDFLLNSGLYDEMYRRWQKDPASVDESWQKAFKIFESTPSDFTTSYSPELAPPKVENEEGKLKENLLKVRVENLIAAWRTWGHLKANFNPLSHPEGDFENRLALAAFGFSEADLNQFCPTCGLMARERAPLFEILQTLQAIYANKTGYEVYGTLPADEQKWFTQEIENTQSSRDLSIEEKQMILEELSKSELFETFMHTKYVGQKRFSLEGAETLIPMLEGLIEQGADLGVDTFVIGMAHRGRLNVLSNILDKSYKDVFSEFDEGYLPNFEGTGDVKYHKGFDSKRIMPHGKEVSIILSPNPSHLESIDGVVEGQVRGLQTLLKQETAENSVLAILVHGDAALAGQGVVYETLQMQGLEGYKTGGTVHLVINNQIGFTTTPKEGRSTRYCTDIAKTFGNPVIHVNVEDPEGCVKAVKLAINYRQIFHRDIFIDLYCWRKYGHNEGDEPFFTQPEMYGRLKEKKSTREHYRDSLVQSGKLERTLADSIEKEFKKALNEAKESLKIHADIPKEQKKSTPPYKPSTINTAVTTEELLEIGKSLTKLPENIKLHAKIAALHKDRMLMLQGEKLIDWGMGEMLTYSTLLEEGKSVRISGQDVERGTFSHRHAVWVSQGDNEKWLPLNHLSPNQGLFSIYNSHLSEFAVLGFEYGYSVSVPDGLTIWEAQFGDFSNGAQVIIDQYIASSEQKWGQATRLALFLPHGYEGQGPEHSSGRLERFLSLAGNFNMRIVVPSSPHQHFHSLRRQILDTAKKPLISFTPKVLLRHPACVSSLENFTQGRFEEILDDPSPVERPRKVVFCCGKIYYDLRAYADKIKDQSTVFIRIEQLYPLYEEGLLKIWEKYTGIRETLWVQEEPQNMGAWSYLEPRLEKILKTPVRYIGRETSASPATGIYVYHKKEVQDIMEEVFSKDQPTTFEIAGQFRA